MAVEIKKKLTEHRKMNLFLTHMGANTNTIDFFVDI